MTSSLRWAGTALLSLGLGAFAADPPNLSGSWHLNVQKSSWGNVTKPISVVLTIQHQEPQFTYQGSVTYVNEESREFGYSGAFDGKPYPMSRSYGDGTITMRRVDAATFESTFKTDDGKNTETTRTTLSSNGLTMTRKLRTTSPEGTKSWTEIYEKR